MKSLNRKFLLLSIVASIVFSSCNINCAGFWSLLFGKNKVAKHNVLQKDYLSMILKSVVVAAIAVPMIFFLKSFFTNQPDQGQVQDNDAVWKTLPVAVSADDILPVAVPAVAVPAEDFSAEDVLVGTGTKSLLNFAQQRVARVIELAEINNILMGDGIGFEVQLNNGQVARNTVYQLRVNPQFTNDHHQNSNSCGPRALYNANVLSQVFDNNNAVFVSDINLLADLNRVPGSHENPKLRQFFNEMISSESVLNNQVFVYPKEVVSGHETVIEGGKEVKKNIMIANPMSGQVDPEDLTSNELENFMNHCRPDNNRFLKIKETDVMDGYSECFDPLMGNRLNNELLYENLVGILNGKNVGYFHSYIIANGLDEGRRVIRKDLNGNIVYSGGHWIAVFVIKTGENEYSWFVLDSMNGNFTNNNQVKAYICKLLGSEYQEYINNVVIKGRNRIISETEDADFKEINNWIDGLRLLNKNRNGNDAKIVVSIRILGLINSQPDRELPKHSLKDKFNSFLDAQIGDVLLSFGSIAQDRKDVLIEKIRDLKNNEKLEMSDNLTDDALSVASNRVFERLVILEKNKIVERAAFERLNGQVKGLLDCYKQHNGKFDVTPELDVEIRGKFKLKETEEFKIDKVVGWMNCEVENLNKMVSISTKEKEALNKEIAQCMEVAKNKIKSANKK